ncbi:MAG TPA: nucleotidyl transferase AbiEii/AbiGii toxin family protein [Polyangiaceae bacterium]
MASSPSVAQQSALHERSSLDELACMKLSAIGSRGKARGFWDLHEILTRTGRSLPDLLEAYGRKYTQHDVGHVVRSLVYFGDAAAEPMPEGLDESSWDGIQRDLERLVLELPP